MGLYFNFYRLLSYPLNANLSNLLKLVIQAALSAIEKLNIGVSPRVPMYQLFTAGGPDPSGAELAKMRETATFYLGTENMHQGNLYISSFINI